MSLLGAPTNTALGTTVGNDLSADGLLWAQANSIIVDKFNSIIVPAQRNNAGSKFNVFVWSNDGGATWTDGATQEAALERGAHAYDSVNDVIHTLWLGTDFSSQEGIIYRRYTITRDGSNHITAISRDGTTNLQLDFQSGAASMQGGFPVLLWLNDAAYGTYGALVALWSVSASAPTVGYEYRASMCVFGSTATQGATAGNWSAPVTADTTTLGTGTAPQVAYSRLAGRTGTNNGVTGSLAALRKSASSHAKDLYLFYYDANGAGEGQWSYRRAQWNSGANNWSTGLTAAQVVGQVQRSGTDTGYGLKSQLISKVAEDAANDRVWCGFPVWKSNASGDTQCIFFVDSSDVPAALTDVYSAGGAHVYAPTLDISIDAISGTIFVGYDVSGAADTNDFHLAGYSLATLAQTMPDTAIYTTHGVDIPLLVPGRYTVAGVDYLLALWRWTFNTPTPPYTGFVTLLAFLAGPPKGTLGMLGVGA